MNQDTICRQLAETKLGAKRRKYQSESMDEPTTAEWQETSVKPGESGWLEICMAEHCMAEYVKGLSEPLEVQKNIPRQVASALQFREHLETEQEEKALNTLSEEIYQGTNAKAASEKIGNSEMLRSTKARKLVPQWESYLEAPRELLLLALVGQEHHQDTELNDAKATKQNFKIFYRVSLRIRRKRFSLLCWQVDMGVSHGTQDKTMRRKVINVLNPSCKAHQKAIWKRAERCTCGIASGFLTKRRQEQTILTKKVLQWRHRKARKSWTVDLYDVKSAFQALDTKSCWCYTLSTENDIFDRMSC